MDALELQSSVYTQNQERQAKPKDISLLQPSKHGHSQVRDVPRGT